MNSPANSDPPSVRNALGDDGFPGIIAGSCTLKTGVSSCTSIFASCRRLANVLYKPNASSYSD